MPTLQRFFDPATSTLTYVIHDLGHRPVRTGRDAEFSMPALILPSLQVNIRAGALPEPESDGRRYLKIPLNAGCGS